MFKNIFLLLKCYGYALVRGRAITPAVNPKSICIIQTAQMGDMVCTTPMFRAIKKQYPSAKVFVVGTALNEQVLRGNPDVDVYIVWNGKVAEMAQKIRALGCDFGCTTSPNFTGLAALYLAGVPCIAVPRVEGGWSPMETRPYRLLRWLAIIKPHGFESYAPREYLRLLEPIGIHIDDTKKWIYWSDEAQQSVLQKLKNAGLEENKFAVIAPGAGHKVKQWPPERFAELTHYLVGKGLSVAVIGTPQEKEEIDGTMCHAHPTTVNMGGQLSIEELKAFIAKAALFISADTGPVYIAEATGVPTIDIVGPVDERIQPPRGPKNLAVVPPRKRATMFIMNPRIFDDAETRRQAQATTVTDVTHAINMLLILPPV